MAKIGTIAWHKEQIKKKSAKYKGRTKKIREKKSQLTKDGYDNTNKEKSKIPQTRYRSRVEYDFLKYIRVVFKWAVDNNPELNRPQIELLLYLHGLGAFSKKQFADYHKLMSMYQQKTLRKFLDEGWVTMWRPKKGREYALYVLTRKAKMLCRKMHVYCAGLEEMSENPLTNKMYREDAPRINNYYTDMIKRMNKDRVEK